MSLARSAFIVLNGKAAGREDVRAAVGAARGDALDVEVGVTWEGADAERFARRAAREGFEVPNAPSSLELIPGDAVRPQG
jgi:hypothetical protein